VQRAAFALFDKDGNADISKKEMREAVQRIYRERKSLVASLKDVSSAVAKLDAVLLCIVLLLLMFICLLILNPQDTITSLVPLATIVLGFSFIFGHSCQLLFESMLFLFSTHTFDIGDLVQIDDMVRPTSFI
jgi:small-conductance mechanosensitive channel